MNLSVWGLYIFSLLVFGTIGYYILTKRIINDFEIKKKKVLFTFTSIFAFSVNSLTLILFEIFSLGDEDQRLTKWVITLSYLVYSSLLMVPSIFIYKCISRFKLPKRFKQSKKINH